MTSPAAVPDRDEVWTAVLAHRDRAMRVARARCSNPADVEDCVQESFARVVAMPNVDLNRLGPLLSTVVANVATDAYRSSDRGRRLQDRVTAAHVETTAPDDDVCDAAEARWLRDQLAQLRERDRAVLALRADGYSLPEAAAALGITYKAAESAYTRARNSMKTLWRVTLGAVGVLFGGRLQKDLALGSATVAVAAVVVFTGAVGEQSADAQARHDGGRPATAHTTSAGSHGEAVHKTGAAESMQTPRREGSTSQARSAGPSRSVATTGPVNVGPVDRGSAHVQREHEQESLQDTLVRCAEKGVVVEPTRVDCRS